MIIFGLGNPGKEYEGTRHNAGKEAALRLKDLDIKKVKIVESEEFMNNSGRAIAKFVKSKKDAEKLVVVYDDLDLGLGTVKISFNKGSGGHRGLESVIKAVKTREFSRIRIGVSPTTASGKVKKPEGEQKVLDFILAKFKPAEQETLKKVFKKVEKIVETIATEGRDRAMNEFN